MSVNFLKGMLIEYALSLPPLVLEFEFNPQTISRTRSVTITTGNAPGTQGGYGFSLPGETARVAQGVSVEPENFSLEVLFDAGDAMADSAHPAHALALVHGIEPQLDTLRSMVEPKTQGPGGVQMLAGLGLGEPRAFQRDQYPSVLLLVWGTHILPVFLKSVQVQESAHLPTLIPYRATVTLEFQVIESDNPFYNVERARLSAGAAVNIALGGGISGSFVFGGGF